MDLDIVVIYLLVLFFLLWLIYESNEHFSNSYAHYKQLAVLKSCLAQAQNQLTTAQNNKHRFDLDTWHYNYWQAKEKDFRKKFDFCNDQLKILQQKK